MLRLTPEQKCAVDERVYGESFMLDGRRVSPSTVRISVNPTADEGFIEAVTQWSPDGVNWFDRKPDGPPLGGGSFIRAVRREAGPAPVFSGSFSIGFTSPGFTSPRRKRRRGRKVGRKVGAR